MAGAFLRATTANMKRPRSSAETGSKHGASASTTSSLVERMPVAPSGKAKEKRLEAKRLRSRLKRERSADFDAEE